MTLKDAAQDLRPVRLQTGSRTLSPALATKDILFKISLTQFQSGRYSVKHYTDSLTMRLTKNCYPEFPSECIHNYLIKLFQYYLPTFCALVAGNLAKPFVERRKRLLHTGLVINDYRSVCSK